MRTTVTLDDDVAEKLTRLAHARRTSFKAMLNEMLRRGMAGQRRRDERPFKVEPHDSALCPGVDPLKLNQLADQLEAEAFRSKAGL